MKVYAYDSYGGPDRLFADTRPDPDVGDTDVLISVEAVGLNGSDLETLRGSPAYARLNGLRRPRRQVLGTDIAGVVLKTGPGVTRFAEGDRVFGDILDIKGGLAERVAAPERKLARCGTLTATEAAALPQNGAIALQGIGDASLQGKRVLINGAGGAAGTLAVQRARALGAEVITAVDRGSKLARLSEIGATEGIDFERKDFTAQGDRWDLILDLFGTRGAGRVVRALKPDGRYRIVGGPVGALLSCGLIGSLHRSGGRSIGIMALKQSTDVLERLAGGVLDPIIDSIWPFEETPAAFAHMASGNSVGKVVITL
ncbi:NAD(P)-dependent alcohol dehydrogenase [Pelagovum pacificum]|uniref:NAD(P)-dependent alcohol dehydrogenase n=1 Tax=Pelagovum pacificum TaxID=2588711 RepID=A0A5C5GDG6_9RHOB|nr:NAD(P)-dependent alcohol dehydrogenase [Pelagovum pacificum]QQA41163.1 NAD(P)-dependent alcohol dehydrogenase [Pelagovum pacificum]TNY32029.1 NAD(P)-dependent alcohol dehydrogenase [Pelagovum pacificum]